MKFLIVLSLASMAVAAPEGPLPYYHRSYYQGPQAIPVVLPSGHLADTPEVAAAKNAHFAEHSKALSHASHYVEAPERHYAPAPAVQSHYAAPAAVVESHYSEAPERHYAPAPEVQSFYDAPAAVVESHYVEAPVRHYAPAPAVQSQYAAPAVVVESHYEEAPERSHYATPVVESHYVASPAPAVPSHYVAPAPAPASAYASYAPQYYKAAYHGPLATPTVLPSGHLADTPEVAAAKYAHHAQHARTLSHHSGY